MKTASIRELKHDTNTVLAWVTSGERVEIQRRGKPVAMLSRRCMPPPSARKVSGYQASSIRQRAVAVRKTASRCCRSTLTWASIW